MQENTPQDFDSFDEIDLTHLFSLLRRNFWLLLLGLLLAGGAAFGFSRYQTPIYEAKTQVMVTRASSSSGVGDVTQMLNTNQLSQTYVEMLSQDWFRELAAEQVGGEIDEDAVKVSAATNTQIITVTVEDPNPARAMAIADILVQVLITQNENIQSGRYISAEESLDSQIQEMEAKITTLQAELEIAEESVVSEQIAKTQEGIASTQAAITEIETEIERLEDVWTDSRARLLLYNEEARLRSNQAILDRQLKNYQALEEKIPSDNAPRTEEEQQIIIAIQSEMAELGVEINATREELSRIQEEEIDWLTPLIEEDGVDKALIEQENNLAVQEALLESYKTIVTELLATDESQKVVESITTLEGNLELYKEIYLNLLDNRETIRRERAQDMTNVIQLTPAIPSEEPVRPRILLNTALGAIAGLILAVAIVLLTDFLDTTLKTREDVEKTLNLPVMGRLLQIEESALEKDGPYVVHAPRSPVSEAFRSLRTNLEFIGVDKPLKSILISSPGASEGKTTVAANLAAVIAQSGKKVVILDADLRRPRMHREMGVVNRMGLSDVFRDKVALKDVIQPWDDISLSVITSGGIPPNPAELLGSEKMSKILADLEAEFDMVIIDSTPTLVTDSQLIAARVGGVLLVLWPGRTQAEAARATVEQYRRVGARMLGAVLNNIQPGQGYGGYNTYQYYQYDRETKNGGFKMPWNRKAKKK